jgi:O-antigen ligase
MTVFSKINKQFIPLGLLLFFVISLPLKNNINSISIILLTLYSVYFQFAHRSFNLKTFKNFTPFVVYFVVALLSVLYSENTSRAFKSINRLLPFILLPFVFSTLLIVKKQYHMILYCFASFMVFLCLFSHTKVLIKLYENNDILFNIFNNKYSYLSLSQDTVGIHSTYYAYFVLTAIIVFLHLLLKAKTAKLKTVLVVVIAYLSFFIFHLSSRLPIVVLFLLFNGAIIYYFFSKKKLKTGVIYLLLLYGLTFVIGYNIRITRYRFQQVFGFTYANGNEFNDGLNKLQQFNAGIQSNNNVLLGNGIGDANDEIYKAYRNLGLDTYAERKYNAHNQFIQTYGGLGLLGVVVLLAIFGYALFVFIREKNFIGILFVLSSLLLFQTESMLERHHGIALFVFLICFEIKRSTENL